MFFTFGTSTDHLARAEDQRRRTWFTNSHDYGGKSFGIVFGISGSHRNAFQVELAIEIDRGHYVLQYRT